MGFGGATRPLFVPARAPQSSANGHPRRPGRARRGRPPRRGPRRPLPPPRRNIGTELGPGRRRGDGNPRPPRHPVHQRRCRLPRQGRRHHRSKSGTEELNVHAKGVFLDTRTRRSRPCAKAVAASIINTSSVMGIVGSPPRRPIQPPGRHHDLHPNQQRYNPRRKTSASIPHPGYADDPDDRQALQRPHPCANN